MNPKRLYFVSFKPEKSNFKASMLADDFLSFEGDAERLMFYAVSCYTTAVSELREFVADMNYQKEIRKPISARVMWSIGNVVFQLISDLQTRSLILDDIYAHLSRDVDLKYDELKKAIIFRRYLKEETLIPKNLSWRRCRDRARSSAKLISKGKLPG